MAESAPLVALYYALDPAALAPRINGVRAYVAQDRRDPARRLLALPCAQTAPPQAGYLALPPAAQAVNTVLPVDFGTGRDPATGAMALFVIFPGLPASSLADLTRPMPEAELIQTVLLPVAAALDQLAALHLTHRAVRPDNLFTAGRNTPVMLGPGFAAPPASHQGAVFEPPYVAWCHPTARGPGLIADDVYALGVTLLTLHRGVVPLAGIDEREIIRRKIELGCYEALTAGTVLPPMLADLLRAMLAEVPDHRPTPAALLTPETARIRRLAARPPRRAQRPIDLAGSMAWSARDLAYAMASTPDAATAALRSGQIDNWIRRGLGDSQLALKLEDCVHARTLDTDDDGFAGPLAVMRAIAVLDPLAPLVWRGIAVFPNGLGPALASGAGQGTGAGLGADAIAEIIAHDVIASYAACLPRARRTIVAEAREWRTLLLLRGIAGGIARLVCVLNPGLPCASPLLGGRLPTKLADLLAALEQASASADRKHPPIDPSIACFIAAHGDGAMQNDAASIAGLTTTADQLAILRLFARLQVRLHPQPLPGLAAWLLAASGASLAHWQSRSQREAAQAQLVILAQAGGIAPMLAVLDNPAERDADRTAATDAANRAKLLATLLADIAAGAPRRKTANLKLGHDLAASIGLIAACAAGLRLALG